MIESPVWLAETNPPLFHSGTDEETAPLASGEDDGLGDSDLFSSPTTVQTLISHAYR